MPCHLLKGNETTQGNHLSSMEAAGGSRTLGTACGCLEPAEKSGTVSVPRPIPRGRRGGGGGQRQRTYSPTLQPHGAMALHGSFKVSCLAC